MPKFIYTYGLEGHPFEGGWTEIEAPDIMSANAIFRAFHPDKYEGFLNCCSVYTEEEFKATKMSGPDGNHHKHCQERFTFTHEIYSEKETDT